MLALYLKQPDVLYYTKQKKKKEKTIYELILTIIKVYFLILYYQKNQIPQIVSVPKGTEYIK